MAFPRDSSAANREGHVPVRGQRAIDLEKRRRVMARSMRLGHCICNPKQPCPCEVFRQHDVCPCAGERLPTPGGEVRLTRLVERPGCASKIDAARLRRLIAGLPSVDDPRVLVGMPAGDDAGVYRLDEGVVLVQTVDVFSPSVDDPYTFGQVAAANSLSDVYAMGGRPVTALSIVGFPVDSLPEEILRAILRGGIDKMNEAGVAVLGGHSINDREIKAGFAVTGLVHPEAILTNAGLRPGDRLVLTKPLGTGVLAFAAQLDRAPREGLAAAAASMAQLNRQAAERMLSLGAHACTDVTGFGLAGHLASMAAASGAKVEIVWDDLPVLPGVLECLAEGLASGGVERNREAFAEAVHAEAGVSEAMLDLCFDPQTSGGLLVALDEPNADRFLGELREAGVTAAATIGRVLGPGTGQVVVRASGARPLPAGGHGQDARGAIPAVPFESRETAETPMSDETVEPCCGSDPGSSANPPAPSGDATNVEARFGEFVKAAGAPGALDAHTKQAMAIALSVLAKCEPCVKSHIKKALAMGFSQEEIDEAAWMAIAFGGAPLMMFYKGLRRVAAEDGG